MADQTPVPPPPPPPAASAVPPPPPPPPAPATPPAAPGPSGSGPGNGRKGFVGIVAVAVLLGGGYGAYAVYDRLDGGGPQPHDVLPASTDAYVRLDLDPSAGQKVDLFKLIREFPDAAEELGITSDDQDIRELVFKQVLSSECEDLDYDEDVEPWLGDRIGVGFDADDNGVLVAVQTSDEKASRQGIEKLFACTDDSYGIAYRDGYAILAPEQADVDAAIKATDRGTLGDDEDFVKDFEQLGNQGVASGWADLAAVSKVPELADSSPEQAAQLAKAGSVAMTLRVDGSVVELAAVGGPEQGKGAKDAPSLAELPTDTVVALSLNGVGDGIAKNLESVLQELDSIPALPDPAPRGYAGLGDDDLGGFAGFSPRGFIEQFEQASGLQVPEDITTLFGDNLTLAIGGDKLETIPQMSGPEGLSELSIALSLTSDPAKALDLVQRLATLASDAGVPMVTTATDDGAVLASNATAAGAIDKGGKLGDDKVFRSVIAHGDDTSDGFYVDVGTILDKLLKADPPKDVRDVIEDAKVISAVGLSVSRNGDDRPLTSLRIAFDK